MTNNERYKNELDGVKTSSAFKQNAKQWLRAQMEAEETQEAPAQKPKLKWFAPRRLAAAACVLLVFAGGFVALRSMSFGASAPMAMETAASAPAAAPDMAEAVTDTEAENEAAGQDGGAEQSDLQEAPEAGGGDQAPEATTGTGGTQAPAAMEETEQDSYVAVANEAPMMQQSRSARTSGLWFIAGCAVFVLGVVGLVVVLCVKKFSKKKQHR